MPRNRRKTIKPVKRTAHMPSTPQQAGELIKQTWEQALRGLSTAQHDLQRQMRKLLKRNRIDASDARALLQSLNSALERERKQALHGLEARVKRLQQRAARERKALGQRVQGAVQSTFSSLNIPSRREVQELTRKVEALSARIDRLRR